MNINLKKTNKLLLLLEVGIEKVVKKLNGLQSL